MTKIAYVDVCCGASGDMLLAAFLDAGAPVESLRADLGRLPISGLRVEIEKIHRHGILCAHMKMGWEAPREIRHLPEIIGLIQRASLPARVVERARAVLTRLAEAEAAVHGVSIDHVHFHEIGAVDTIVDIVGVALCMEYLGVEELRFSELTDGWGSVRTEHGVMPVPVPATARMIAGLRFRGLDIEGELLTPTGAALLTGLGTQADVFPAGRIECCGYGCGDRDYGSRANALRVFVIETNAQGPTPATTVCVLESDMDHVSGEVMAFTAEECMAAGALDVSWVPLLMKKGRPAYRLTVVCEHTHRERLTDIIIRQTRTLGVRWHEMQRTVAQRGQGTATVGGREVAEKRCTYKGYTFRKIEYEALAALARATGRPLPELLEEYLCSVHGLPPENKG